MSFDVRVFGDGNLDDAVITYELPANSSKENIYDMARLKAEYGFISIQALSTTDLTIEVYYSNWYTPTVLPTETWFTSTTISVSANTPILQQISVPFCKFIKLLVKNETNNDSELAIHTISV